MESPRGLSKGLSTMALSWKEADAGQFMTGLRLYGEIRKLINESEVNIY